MVLSVDRDRPAEPSGGLRRCGCQNLLLLPATVSLTLEDVGLVRVPSLSRGTHHGCSTVYRSAYPNQSFLLRIGCLMWLGPSGQDIGVEPCSSMM